MALQFGSALFLKCPTVNVTGMGREPNLRSSQSKKRKAVLRLQTRGVHDQNRMRSETKNNKLVNVVVVNVSSV